MGILQQLLGEQVKVRLLIKDIADDVIRGVTVLVLVQVNHFFHSRKNFLATFDTLVQDIEFLSHELYLSRSGVVYFFILCDNHVTKYQHDAFDIKG